MTAVAAGTAWASARGYAAKAGGEGGGVGVALGRFEPLVELGLVTLLEKEPGVSVIARGLRGAAVTAMLANSRAPVAILDEHACYGQTLGTLAADVGVVVLARTPTTPLGRLLVGAGVSCVHIGACEDDLLDAIRLTARGGCVFLAANRQQMSRGERQARLLTTREVRALRLLSHGHSYAEIAGDLGISVPTVRKHAGSVYRKLGARGKRQLLGLPVDWLDDPCSRRSDSTLGYESATVVVTGLNS